MSRNYQKAENDRFLTLTEEKKLKINSDSGVSTGCSRIDPIHLEFSWMGGTLYYCSWSILLTLVFLLLFL